MKENDFDKERLLDLIGGLLDDGLDSAGRRELTRMLEVSPDARKIYLKQMDLHARLHLDHVSGLTPALMREAVGPRRRRGFPLRRLAVGAIAASIAVLAALAWPETPGDHGFARIESTSAARWESSNLPTTTGSRLGQGTLRLADGLATLRFDSGASITLEAPAELTLVDAMRCILSEGTVVGDIPDSAHGFLITTPSAEVIDHGTRFSVVVDGETKETQTRVHDGLVEVGHRTSDRKVMLRDGQFQSAGPEHFGESLVGPEQPFNSRFIGPPARSAQWRRLTTIRDAYIGRSFIKNQEVHRSETLLLVKNGTVHRKAYLGFDLSGIEPEQIAEAELALQFAPTGWGLASLVPEATFGVYGLLEESPWNGDSIVMRNAPANRDNAPDLVPSQVSKLGSFVMEHGVQRGRFGINGERLADFLRERAGSEVTLIVIRETPESRTNGLVHGFASRRHPELPGPLLSIRLSEP
jgi:ferric-dicitrate binding protein FerR (iron transport regulator)